MNIIRCFKPIQLYIYIYIYVYIYIYIYIYIYYLQITYKLLSYTQGRP